MYRLFFLITTSLIVLGCGGRNHNQEQNQEKKRKDLLRRVTFDQDVISAVDTYNSIGKSIKSNVNSIVPKGRNDIFFVYNKHEKLFQPEIDFLSSKDYELLKELAQKNFFGGVRIGIDSTITFVIRNTHIPEYRFDIREKLTNKSVGKNHLTRNNFAKDTTISGWTYKVWIDKRVGW